MLRLIEYGVFRLALVILRWTPRPAAFRLARLFWAAADRLIPRLRRVARFNLEIAGFEGRADLIFEELLDSLARLAVVFAKLPGIGAHGVGKWIRYEGLRNFEDARAQGRGVLIATAHLGNWELSAHAHALLTGPMSVVVRPLDNPRIDAFVERRRAAAGNRVIAKRHAAREILRSLKRNEAVGILVDQNVLEDEAVFVDFFGIAAAASPLFARLAAHSGAPVILGFAIWNQDERRYVLQFTPALELTGNPHTDTQRIHSALEDWIRRYPGQWLWIHRRWKTRPPGEQPLY